MIKCPFCHFENENGALFCERCTSDVCNVAPTEPQQKPAALRKSCPACGSNLLEGAVSCMDCGYLIQSDYPPIYEYVEALEHPSRCFRDPGLQASQAESDPRGAPLPRTGGSGAVFKLMNGATSVAVKVFKIGQARREFRYRILGDYLAALNSPHLVGFRYQQEGIRVGYRWYPILVMDWVEGVRLTDQVGAWIREGNTQALLHLANQWEELIRHLESNRIAHGDLEHGNVLVAQQKVVLVDYDGTCVPALEGQQAWESGLTAYQHPRRAGQPLSLRMDDFSAWVIWIALRALAADPSLWQRYVEFTCNDNLLFSDVDVLHPHHSHLWPELLSSPDPEVVRRAEQLRASIEKPFTEVPVFSLDSEVHPALAGDWSLAARLADELTQAGLALPHDLEAAVREARRHRAGKQKLEAAIATGDPYPIVAAYEPTLFRDWPACELLVAQARKAHQQLEALEELTAALNQNDRRTLIALWERYEGLLQGVAAAEEIAKRVAEYRLRRTACNRLVNLLLEPTCEQDIVDAWNDLQTAGGHPDLPLPAAQGNGTHLGLYLGDPLLQTEELTATTSSQVSNREHSDQADD